MQHFVCQRLRGTKIPSYTPLPAIAYSCCAHLTAALLSTLYFWGKRLALEQGRSLNPLSIFTAQSTQVDDMESSSRA